MIHDTSREIAACTSAEAVKLQLQENRGEQLIDLQFGSQLVRPLKEW